MDGLADQERQLVSVLAGSRHTHSALERETERSFYSQVSDTGDGLWMFSVSQGELVTLVLNITSRTRLYYC